jgi:anti-sigma factor RsiW
MPRAAPPKRPRRAASGAGRNAASRSMRECREVIDLLTEYLEGGLALLEARRLEAHLASCDACAGFLASLRTVRAAVGNAKVGVVPEDCRRALRSYLAAGMKRRKR